MSWGERPVQLKQIDFETMKHIFPDGCVTAEEFTSLKNKEDALTLVKTKVKEHMNTFCHTVKLSKAYDGNYSVDARAGKLLSSKIYCWQGVTATDKNFGSYDEREQARKFYNQTRNQYGFTSTGLSTDSPHFQDGYYETMTDFMQGDQFLQWWDREGGRKEHVSAMANNPFTTVGKAFQQNQQSSYMISANGGKALISVEDYLNGTTLPVFSTEPVLESSSGNKRKKTWGLTSKEDPVTVTTPVKTAANLLAQQTVELTAGSELSAQLAALVTAAVQKQIANGMSSASGGIEQILDDDLNETITKSVDTFLTPSKNGGAKTTVSTAPSANQLSKLFVICSGVKASSKKAASPEAEQAAIVAPALNDAEKLAISEMTRILNRYSSLVATLGTANETFETKIPMMSERPSVYPSEGLVDFTSMLFTVMSRKGKGENTVLADTVKEWCTNLTIVYPTKAQTCAGAEGFQPKEKALMLVALMIWTFFSTGVVKSPTFENNDLTLDLSENSDSSKTLEKSLQKS